MRTAITEGHRAEPPARLSTPGELRRWSERCRAAGLSIGLVPTMGALHAGHASLVRRAVADCDRVVVSIFVNPRQFGAGEDLARYPRTLDADLEVVAAEGAAAVFTPSAAAMYPDGAATAVHVDASLTGVLEGARRPGHFDGVALVVTKLLNAARPDRAYFGQKDAQQCAVVRRLAADLDTGVEVIVCPVVRDVDGLALSSRNVYLSRDERARAQAIPRGLTAAAAAYAAGERSARVLCDLAQRELAAVRFEVDYVAAVEPLTFSPVELAGPGCQILVAGRMGATRLIDVIRLGIDPPPLEGVGPEGSQVPEIIGIQGRE